MSEQGYGSPNTTDSGYGDSSNLNNNDSGYGSPFINTSQILYVFGETRFAPEYGGEKIEVIGDFKQFMPTSMFGITAAFINGVDVYPVYSGVPTFKYNFMTDVFKRKLTLYTPPLPQAVYDLRLTFSDNTEVIFEDVIEVINSSRYEEVYSIRQSLPQHWSIGSLNMKGTLPHYDIKESNLDILTQSIGEAINATSGFASTKLMDDFRYDDTECTVESTYNFKKSGTVFIGSVKCTYDGVTANQLLNVNRLTELNMNVSEGSKVAQSRGKINEALEDTLINTTSDPTLEIISGQFGLDRPNFILSKYFKNMLKETVYNAKGTYGVLLAGVEAIFDQWAETQWTLSGVADSSNSIEFENHDSIPVWENRWMRIKKQGEESQGKLYYSTLRNSNNFLFADVNTSIFSAANFEVGATYEIKVLPFVIEEDINGLVRIYIDGDIFSIAGIYLRENGEERENEPFGMHLMNISSTVEEERFTTESNGPHPLYFSQDELSDSQNAEFGTLFDELVCSGIWVEVLNRFWVSGESSGLSGIFDIVQSGTVGSAPLYIEPEL